MKKAVLFEQRIKEWAWNQGVVVQETGYIDETGFYYVDIVASVLYWRDLKALEYTCDNMGLEIYNITDYPDLSSKNEKVVTIWMF